MYLSLFDHNTQDYKGVKSATSAPRSFQVSKKQQKNLIKMGKDLFFPNSKRTVEDALDIIFNLSFDVKGT